MLATRNGGKIKEIKLRLNKYPIIIESLENYPGIPEIEETGKTFEENSILKAREISLQTNLPALADDSGLEIYHLENKPGIYSSRWGSTDKDRIQKVIQALENSDSRQRNAQFVCIMCLYVNKNNIFTTKGICKGRITLSPKGNSGFGYDPIFIPEGYNETFAQLGDDIKNKISHRAIALQKMIKIIIRHFNLN